MDANLDTSDDRRTAEGSAESHRGLLARIVAMCGDRPWTTIALVAALTLWGHFALRRAPLDAVPDISDTQVIILTEWTGQSPDLVEDQVTYPISAALLSAPRVESVRGQSFFGLSFVYVIFEEGTDLYWARSRVTEYMAGLGARLPEGVNPVLGPDATAVGWIYQYALVDRSGHNDLAQLRSLQDWTLRYALESVPGVAEVAPVGGMVRQYEVRLDPTRMRAFDVDEGTVAKALRDANREIGGRTLEVSGHEHMVRGRGYVRDADELGLAPVGLGPQGTPILVRDVAEVVVSPAPRRGIAELDGEGEAVGGIVIMRSGQNALEVIEAVEARLEELEPGLPEGVEVVTTYDRSVLIRDSIATLQDTLFEEMLVVSLVIFVFLLHARSALVAIVTIPLSVLLAFIPMYYQGLTANIMSLGGIAVAIGAMVDAAIILIENVHQRVSELPADTPAERRRHAVIEAMQEVAPSIFFSLLVITVSFLPVFTLQGAEGRIFRPLALTKTYSMGFAAFLAVTLTPALAVLFIRGQLLSERHNPINRVLVALYSPLVRLVVRHRKSVLVGAVLTMVLSVPAYLRLGSEFMPPLNEGVILYMPSAPPGMSMTEASRVLQQMDRELREFPEVESVFGKMGRAETATDPAPIGMAETVIVLKPRDQWRDGMTWDALIAEMDEKLRYPGMPNIWWMPIQTRSEMLSTGVRAPLGIQVFGDDIAQLERVAIEIEDLVSTVPGTRSAFAERATGGFFVDIEVDRAAAARHGLSVADVQGAVETGIGGKVVSELVDGRERYDITVRYAPEYRDDVERLSEVLVRGGDGSLIPLRQVADVHFETGPPMIRSEDGQLVSFVFVDTDRPIADYVEEAKALVGERLDLASPERSGIRLDWIGQYRHLERAEARLRIVLPLTLGLVVFLLLVSTRSWIETGIVLLAVPFSLVGAAWLLYFLDYQMSVAVWVGVIALAGLDAETGVVMLLYLRISHRRAVAAGRMRNEAELEAAIVEGAAHRVRPKLMTVMTTMIGLLPILSSDGVGADVMKRIAAPMVGGLVSSLVLELTVYPAVFAVWKGFAVRRQASEAGSAGARVSVPSARKMGQARDLDERG